MYKNVKSTSIMLNNVRINDLLSFPTPWFVSYVNSAEINYENIPVWRDVISPVDNARSTSQTTKVIPMDLDGGYIPRTTLGKRLLTLRAQAIASGMKLLSEEEILEEIQRRRGEL